MLYNRSNLEKEQFKEKIKSHNNRQSDSKSLTLQDNCFCIFLVHMQTQIWSLLKCIHYKELFQNLCFQRPKMSYTCARRVETVKA